MAEWRKRSSVEDLKTGPKPPPWTTLTQAGGDGPRVPAAHPAAIGRLHRCVVAVDPASDTVSAASSGLGKDAVPSGTQVPCRLSDPIG